MIQLSVSTDDYNEQMQINDMHIVQVVDKPEPDLLHSSYLSASLLNIPNTPMSQFQLETEGKTELGILYSVLNSQVLDGTPLL